MDRLIKYSMAADSQMSRRGYSVEQEHTERMNSRENSMASQEYMKQFKVMPNNRLGASFKNQPQQSKNQFKAFIQSPLNKNDSQSQTQKGAKLKTRKSNSITKNFKYKDNKYSRKDSQANNHDYFVGISESTEPLKAGTSHRVVAQKVNSSNAEANLDKKKEGNRNGDGVDVVSGESFGTSSMRSSLRNDTLADSVHLNSKMSPRSIARYAKNENKKLKIGKKNLKKNFVKEN